MKLARHLAPAILITVTLTLLLGVVYPLAVTRLAQLLFPDQARGTLLHRAGRGVGARLGSARRAAGQRARAQPRPRRHPAPGAHGQMTTTQPSAESFLNLIHRWRRGRLKVYLGYGPGVGKTYQMLLEGHRLKAQGVDVGGGLVEPHTRAHTQSTCLLFPHTPPPHADSPAVH